MLDTARCPLSVSSFAVLAAASLLKLARTTEACGLTKGVGVEDAEATPAFLSHMIDT